MKLISKGYKYVIAYEESDGAEGFYFCGKGRQGGIYGAMQLILAEGLDVRGDEPLDEEIPEDIKRVAQRMLDDYKAAGFFQ